MHSLHLQIPSPYAAVQQGWPQQQPQQQGAAMPGQPPLQYPYPHFMPVLLPYGMPPAVQGMPPGAFRVQVAHPAAAQGPPYAGCASRTALTPQESHCCLVLLNTVVWHGLLLGG